MPRPQRKDRRLAMKGTVVAPATASSIESKTDRDLVDAARAGGAPDFRRLLEKYYSLVCSVAYAMTGSRSQSEEVAQETFIAAWTSLGKLRRPDQFRSWICGIA